MSKLIKICGNRPLFFVFISIILSMLTIYGIYANKIYVCIGCLFFFALLLIYSKVQNDKQLFIALLISFIMFGIYGFANFNYVDLVKVNPDTTYTITGYVPTTIYENGKTRTIVLENCKVQDGEKVLYSNIGIRLVLTNEDANITTGDVIKFENTLIKENLFDYGEFNSYNLPYGIIFTTICNSNDINLLQNKISLKDKIRLHTKEAFESSLDNSTSALAYAVIFGDKSALNSKTIDGFRYSGLSHILAVSGLHTTLLFGLFAFLLSRVRALNRNATGIIISILILFYAYICSFSPSVVRAGIMCIVMYFSLTSTYKQDPLTSLSLAGIVVLLINPLDLFNIGFCLSFACMFGIILFANKLTLFPKFTHLKTITAPFAITLSTQIATLPFLAKYFGYFTFISFFSNIILLPLFLLLFTFLVICALISIIIVPTHLLSVIQLGLTSFTNLSIYISQFDAFIIDLCKIGVIGILCYLILMYVLANKFFIKRITKYILSSVLILTIILSCIISSLPKTEINKSFSLKSNPNAQYFMLNDGSFCLINPFKNHQTVYETSKMLKSSNQNTITNLIVSEDIYLTYEMLKDFENSYKIKNVYIAKYLYESGSALINDIINNYNAISIDFNTQIPIGIDAKILKKTETDGYLKYVLNGKQYISD